MEKLESREIVQSPISHGFKCSSILNRDDNEWLKAQEATTQQDEFRCVNRQQRPFQDTGEFMCGFLVGSINAVEGFIEFMATPNSVSDAIIATGPQLDTAVNYYADHVLKGTINDIAHDANNAKQAGHKALATYSKMPAEKRGEAVGTMSVHLAVSEAIADIARMPFKTGLPQGELEIRTPSFRRTRSGAGGY